jgi:hypothetical protein
VALYSANHPNRTVTIHRVGCSYAPKAGVSSCGCATTSSTGNHQWWCEDHVGLAQISSFMGDRFWAVLMCDRCLTK